MNIYTVYFDNKEICDIKTRMDLGELVVCLNDSRKFFAVEGEQGETIILHKSKIEYIRTKGCS